MQQKAVKLIKLYPEITEYIRLDMKYTKLFIHKITGTYVRLGAPGRLK